MNIRKILNEWAERDAERLLTEEDRVFCLQLAQEYVENHKQEKAKKQKAKKQKGKKDKGRHN